MLIGPQCTHSISDSLQVFNRILSEFFDQHARFTTKRTNTNISPWLTVELKNEMDYSDVLMYYYENFASRKQPKTMRNTNVNNLIKSLLDENTKNTTSFSRTLKSIFPTKPKSKLPSTTLKVNKKKYRKKKPSPTDLVNFSSV